MYPVKTSKKYRHTSDYRVNRFSIISRNGEIYFTVITTI